MADREALANILNQWLVSGASQKIMRRTRLNETMRLAIADAILASDWLREVRGALGAHIQADAYRDSIPDDEHDAAYLRKQETWWRLTARSWLDQAAASQCAHVAKERVAASPEYQAVIAGLRAAPLAGAGPVMDVFRPMEDWDQRDETVLLLVDYTDGNHPLDDATQAITIGHNNDHNVDPNEGEGWKFAGWCWSHDHYVQGKGKPVGWMPIPHHLAQEPGRG